MKWILPEQNEQNLLDFLYKSRRIEDTQKFFNPSINHLSSPFLMYGVRDAADYLANVIKAKKKIFIHGDFDVDGITATSILWDFLYKKAGADVTPYIPNRFDEGYGLSETSLTNILAAGGEVVITVDCGVKDMQLVHKYAPKLDFIITDHHTIQTLENYEMDTLPDYVTVVENKYVISKDAKAVVHPKLNPQMPFADICGAFVSWKLVQALNETLGLGVNVQEYLGLVALGTVCDVMPLIGENRTVVQLGLEEARQTKNIGLKSLMDVSGVKPENLEAYHFGFVLGPRLNASGRLEEAIDAVRLLTTSSPQFAKSIATNLNTLNAKRQSLTKDYLGKAEAQLQSSLDNKVLFAYGENWPEGIVGLIAGRLTEKYHRPTLVGSINENLLKGSARSIENFNIAEAFRKANNYLQRHGGHALAAGFSLDVKDREDFYQFVLNLANEQITDEDMESVLLLDGVLNLSELNLDLANGIKKLAPFGFGNTTPCFLVKDVMLKSYQTMGQDNTHVKFLLADETQNYLNCLAFNYAANFKTTLGITSTLPTSNEFKVDVVGNLDIDEWNGNKKLVLKVKDMKVSGSK